MSQTSVFQIFERIEKTSSRNEMVVLLSGFFKILNSSEAQIYSYLLQGRVAPLFVEKEFNFAERSALKVLNNISVMHDLKLDVFKKREELGDAGLVAKEIMEKRGVKESEFDIENLYISLWSLIDIEGLNSSKAKSDIFSELILKSSPLDAKYLTRIISGKLRLGCSNKTILDSYSFFLVGDKSVSEVLNHAYGVVSDLGFVANIVFSELSLEKKINNLQNIKPIPGIPIFPRLVERVGSFENAIERFPEGGVLQPKFDGLRCQIHKGVRYSDIYEDSVWVKNLNLKEGGFGLFEKVDVDESVKLFSRNLNDITEMFPEVVDEIKSMKEESFILDGEIIGWDEKSGSFIPFQETMSRKRKYGISEKVKSVPVKYFAFDMLELDGNNLIDQDLEKRLQSLSELSLSKKDIFNVAENVFFNKDVGELENVFNKYVDEGLEGVILKKLEGGYMPGVRNFDWVKLKKSIGGKVVDTIDAVVLGYYYGSGKKTGFGMGSLLVGVYNPEDETFESVGKLGTGFTDSDWEIVAKRLSPLEMKYKGENIKSELKADVWVQPEVVVTVEADEISKSTVHLAAKSKLNFGLSLRFPRLISFDRDKLSQDCTSVAELIDMWKISLRKK